MTSLRIHTTNLLIRRLSSTTARSNTNIPPLSNTFNAHGSFTSLSHSNLNPNPNPMSASLRFLHSTTSSRNDSESTLTTTNTTTSTKAMENTPTPTPTPTASSQQSQPSSLDKQLRFDYTGIKVSDRVRKLLDLTNGSKREVIKVQKKMGMELFQLREGDTGSSAVQVIAVTTRIQQMQSHLAVHRKDQSGKRTLQRLYVRRRKLLDYMERKEFDSYRHVVKTLGLVR